MTETTNPSVKELKAQIAALQAQVEAVRIKEISEAVAQIQALITEHELTIDHIFPSYKSKPQAQKEASSFSAEKTEKTKVPPKYHHPSGKYWSGRGVMPVVFKEAIVAGAKIEDFLIKPELEIASLL